MKIICDKNEFATLVRACDRHMTETCATCAGCLLNAICTAEDEEGVEAMCEIEVE